MEIVSAIASKLVELLVAPIGRPITYVFNYDDNISNLKEKGKKLETTKERIQHDVDSAERQGEEIESDVRQWRSNVNDITGEIDKILEDEEQATKKCFMGLCPNLKSRCQLSRKARKKLEVIVNLQEEGKFNRVSYPAASQGIGVITTEEYEAFESRTLVLNQILEALKGAGVNMIGLYGMPGVGKTTFLKKVAEQVRKDNMVVLAVVSKGPVLKKIQEHIADWLGFKLEAETVEVRANLLRQRLKKEKKILVILDDIWERLELEDVGIPYGSDHEGCKLLMTSRDLNVLSRDMGVKDNFMLQVLPGNEAWHFFQRMVGNDVQDPCLQSVAPEVAERCAGLPILLATVARALKNGNLSEWKDTLERLKNNEELDARVQSAFELSYHSLKGDEIKSLFLLCGQLIPHSILITDLLKYTMGLGLFKRCNTLEATRHRLYKYVNDLKASCLLLEGNTDGEVNMHDLVQKFAASVDSRDHHVFAAASGTALNEWPTEDVLEKCTAIYLPYCKIPELPAALKCPKTESFILYGEDTSLKIQDDFFREMKKLKLIDLTRVHLSAIPSSLQFLENLQTLCLDGCDLGDIAIVGVLKSLLVLSLIGSNIVRLPREIGQLTRLQLLDLTNNPTLEEIPPNVLSCLTQLEELDMANSFLRWEDEGSKQVRRNASLAELKHLQKLLALDIQITDAKLLPKDLFFDKLERFRIFIGDGWNWLGSYEASKTLKLNLNTSILFEAGIRLLLKRTEDLHLHDPKGVKNILFDLDAEGFHLLKYLHIEESLEIQYIVDSGPSIAAFPRLELLSLDNLNSLEKIFNGRPRKESFSNLRILKIETCHRLKNLFSLSLARGILRIEEIGIANCKIMEVIVAEESEGDAEHKDEALKWSQLRRLTLERLPQLTSICSKVNGPSTSQTKLNDARSNIEIVSENELETPMPAFNKKIVFPNLEDLKLSRLEVEKIWSDQSIDLSSWFQKLTNLTVEGCGKLKYLFTPSMVKSLAHLKRLEICECKLMEEIIVTEGAIASEVVLPKLEFLKLSGLRNLKRFCTSNLIECPLLKELQMENCHALKTFISNSVTANRKSTLFDENVAFPKLERLVLKYMDGLEMIWHHELHSDSFCMLKKLEVEQGKKLSNIFPPKMLRRFKNLEYLEVNECASLEEVFDVQSLINENEAHDLTATQLRKMYLWKLPSLKHVWNGNPQGILSFQNLHTVNPWKCPGLKSLFPSCIAKDLLQLEELVISECGIEEIVWKEEEVEAVTWFEFPRLTSLLLFELPELRRFYPEIHTSEWPVLKELRVYHCEKIAVFDSEIQNLQGAFKEDVIEIQPLFSFGKITSNLEEFALNSKDAKMIREGQFQEDFFHKLKVLELQCFYDESALFPFDLLIQGPHNLEKLVVRHCLFKELFSSGFVGEEEHARALTRIKCLKLDWLPNLERIWNQDLLVDQLIQNLEGLEVWDCLGLTNLAPSAASFQNLRSLDVFRCEGLLYLIASSTARSLVQLTAMTVRECDVMTEIVANEGDESENEIIFRKLQSLTLDCLPSLTSFCTANFTFKFPSMTEVIVKQCPKMETFSQGVLSAPKLQRIWLTTEKDKGQWKGDLHKTIQHFCTEAVGFQGMQQLKLSEFPKLKEVWHGDVLGEIFCDLKSLVVEDCASFLSAISSNLLLSLNNLEELDVRNCESLEEVFNLEGLDSDQGHVGLLSKVERFYLIDLLKLRNVWDESLQTILDFRGLKLLKVHNCRSLRNIFTPSIAAILVQLQELEVKWCPMIEEIITRRSEDDSKTDKIIFPQLHSIILESLPKLTSFYCGKGVVECPSLKSVCVVDCLSTFSSAFLRRQEPTENGAAGPKIVFSNLESMELSSIKLEKTWHDQSCVQKLTSLTMEGCGNLRYLFTSAMVQSLAQLQKLKIYDCKRMEEIIVTEHLGEGENVSEIVFPELSSLVLQGLPKLIRFCICNLIKCPSLEVLRIEKCPNLKTFVSNSVSAEVGTTTSEAKPTNSTLFDDKVAFPKLERLIIKYMDGLAIIWHHELHSDSFCMLKKLEVEQGKKLSNIFPPKMLRRFKNLEYLDVTDCASLEEVFDVQSLINENEAHDLTATQLRRMCLWKLPSLKHVWNGNPQGILSFQNLHTVSAWKCPVLKGLFPSSIAMDLLQLERLGINECGIEEIVWKEEGVEAVPKFEFPRLTFLLLFDLPELRRFYSEMHILEWPVLKRLSVYNCEKLMVFDSEIQKLQGPIKEHEIEIQVPQPLFSIAKIAPNLEEFALNSKDTTMIWEGQFLSDFFHKIKFLAVQCFHGESEDFPFGLLQRFQNIEKLVVRDGHFKQLFPDGRAFEEEHARALTRIRHLTLSRLPDLEHIWNQNFHLDLLLPNLGNLEVFRCSSLIYIAPATVSFQNLRVLTVRQCKALIYLVTSSTAKHLVQLTEMRVEKCHMVTEVVSIEEEEAENEIIIFKKLESLTLNSLASLTSFCSANVTFKFPSLAKVTVMQCPKMKIFSRGVLSTPKLERVWPTRVRDKGRWKGNLNSTIQQLYTEVNTKDSEEE